MTRRLTVAEAEVNPYLTLCNVVRDTTGINDENVDWVVRALIDGPLSDPMLVTQLPGARRP